jgi:adenine phosphoribosyltransferase
MTELNATLQRIRHRVRTIPDWPVPGIQFRDITPVLQDAGCLQAIVAIFAERYRGVQIDTVAGIEARGFILGAVLAHALQRGFVPVRKQGKLPHDTVAQAYSLEYGEQTLELHQDACRPGDRVLLVDDLIATGGTAQAARGLIERLGGQVVELAALIDLPELGGSQRLRDSGLPVHALIAFEGH